MTAAAQSGGWKVPVLMSGAAAVVYLWDTFAGTDGTELNGRTPDTNATGNNKWVSADGNSDWSILNNQAMNAHSNQPLVYDCGVADCTIETHRDDSWGFIVLRYTDANNYWLCGKLDNPTSLIKKVAGVDTTVATGGPVGLAAVVKVVAAGNSIQVYFDGVLTLSTTDSFNNTATKHGVAAGQGARSFDYVKVTP